MRSKLVLVLQIVAIVFSIRAIEWVWESATLMAQQPPIPTGYYQRPLSRRGISAGVSYFGSAPSTGSHAELGVLWPGGTTPPSQLIFDDVNSVWVNTNARAADGTTSLPGMSYLDDLDLGHYRVGTDNNGHRGIMEFDGRIETNVTRQEFNQSCVIMGTTAFVAETVTDAAVNLVLCPGGGGPNQGIDMFQYRIDGAQASPFIVDGAGALDIDNDGANNEGVEIIVASITNAVGGVVDVGTSPETYFKVGFTIASIDGTDNFAIGWKIAGAFVDDFVVATIDTGAAFYWDDAAGNCVITTQDDTADGTDEITACDLSDAEEMHIRIHVNTDGTFDFFHAATELLLASATELTQANAVGLAVADDQLVPYTGYLADTNADSEIKILYVEIGEVNGTVQ